MELRPYQNAAKAAVLDYWKGGGGNPLVDMATGLGKSVVIAGLVRELCEAYPAMRVVMLVHVKELVAQNYQALVRNWPQAPAGVYSAGLGRRDTSQRIVFASIQSIYKRARELGPRDLVIIDEAHLVPSAGDGMYRRLIDDLRTTVPGMRVCGFTATPFRMDSGRLDGGTDPLFDEIVYSYGIAKGIDDGFLTPLVSRGGAVEIDVSQVPRRGGEFVPGALEAAADDDAITQAAVADIIAKGHARKSWLIFCAGIKSAYHVRDAMRAAGVSCETVTGETAHGERDSIIARFKAGQIRCLTNANVLTTGFDAPGVDLIGLLRPTLSPGLYVQMAGRGTRLAPGKTDCLFLDFTGTCRRMGPVDTITIGKRSVTNTGDGDEGAPKVDTVRGKECPECGTIAAISARACRACDHVFSEPAPKHDAKADTDAPILSRDLRPEAMPVKTWAAKHHRKQGGTDSVRVEYDCGLLPFKEWVCFEHSGRPRDRSEWFWRAHGGSAPPPATVPEAIERWGELQPPAAIAVKRNGEWFEVVGRKLNARTT